MTMSVKNTENITFLSENYWNGIRAMNNAVLLIFYARGNQLYCSNLIIDILIYYPKLLEKFLQRICYYVTSDEKLLLIIFVLGN